MQREQIITTMPSNKPPGIDKMRFASSRTVLIQLFMQSRLFLMHSFKHVFFHQNGKQPRLHQFQKMVTMNRRTTIGPSHFYQFCLRFVKGLYTINSPRICNQMTPYQRLKAGTRNGIYVKHLLLKQLTQLLQSTRFTHERTTPNIHKIFHSPI